MGSCMRQILLKSETRTLYPNKTMTMYLKVGQMLIEPLTIVTDMETSGVEKIYQLKRKQTKLSGSINLFL